MKVLGVPQCLSCSSHTSSHPECHTQLPEFPNFLPVRSAPQWKTGMGLDNPCGSLPAAYSAGYNFILALQRQVGSLSLLLNSCLTC